LKKRYQVGLIVIVVLAAYYPTVLSGPSRVDDLQLIESLQQVSGWDLKTLFLPHISGGYYYRPLIALSFRFDKLVLGLYPAAMHLENLLLHLANTILVYMLAWYAVRITSPLSKERNFAPLAAALLFGLHPINSESVNWISGRTDLLAGVFVLSGALFLLDYSVAKRKSSLVLSFLAVSCSVLSKETAVMFVPMFFVMPSIVRRMGGYEHNLSTQDSRRRVLKRAIIVAAALGIVALVFLLRSYAFRTNTGRIGLTIRCINADWMHSLFVVLRAFAFYMKKLLVPLPLNFAIMEIDPLYDIVAVPLLLSCIYIASKRTLASLFFTAGVLMILPAFLLAFGQIAWTPYAERYLYLSAAFMSVSFAVYAAKHFTIPISRRAMAAIAVVGVILFLVSMNRSLLWKNDFELVKDTVQKSPHSRDMKVVYASYLAERGDYDEALRQLQEGSAITLLGAYDERYDLTSAYVAFGQKRYDEAIERYLLVLQKSHGRSRIALQNLVRLYGNKETLSDNEVEKRAMMKKSLEYRIKLVELQPDNASLFQVATDAAALGSCDQALLLFRQVADSGDPGDPYKAIARKRALRIGGCAR
jgi:tetratricopeptide (TPR) repeat protein